MRVAILTDTHFSARKSSRNLHDYFELFYKNVFFPTLEKEGITTVLHLGDAFDNRKSIDFWGLDWTKRVVLDPLKKYDVHMIVGNHDLYLRESTSINSPDLLLKNYPNIKIYSSPQEVLIGGLKVLIVPWICNENEQETLQIIKQTDCKMAMGHLELNGFQAYRGHTIENGRDCKLFDKFDKVFSGHYHTRSNNGKIFYLGNTYEMYWNDVNDTRGFHIFDTETLEHTPVNNPYKLFYNVYYEDTPHQTFDTSEYTNKIVKVIVRKKSNHKSFEKFIDKLHTSGVHELKIVENFDIVDEEKFSMQESENTLSLLNRYVDESEITLNKFDIKQILHALYVEASTVE
jgi:predicted phosphodiesterase